MIDNFELIKPLLEFPNDQIFYFVQLLQRKKDHPEDARLGGSNNNSRLIKSYYITSREWLDIHKKEMIKLCEVFNARACISLNPRNFEKAAFQLLQKVANQMANKDFYGVRKAYNSVLGNYHAEMDKRWLVDIDTKDEDTLITVSSVIQNLQKELVNIENKPYSILTTLPTKSGYHIITQPFNMDKFSKICNDIDVHKNNPTILYCV